MHARKTVLLPIPFVLSFSLVSWAQSDLPEAVRHPLSVRPVSRLTGRIDPERRTRLFGNRHPSAQPGNMIGEGSPEQRLEHMVLVLRPDAAQEEALQELIRA